MWSLPASDFVLHWLSLVAIAAQAMTAALAAGRRSMDWVGVCMLSCITALGGGTIRDVLLGHYPLVWVERPWLLGLISVAALMTIPIARVVHRLNAAFLVLDAIGLVVFTMAGCDVAWQMNASLPIVIVAGMITGWSRDEWDISTRVVGLDVVIKPVEPVPAEPVSRKRPK